MQPSNERGFTLVEVLVAFVILTVALVAMAEMMAITLRLQQLGRNQTAAARMAQDKIDELMSMNFASAQVSIGGSLTADLANHFDIPTLNGVAQPFRRRWTVATGPVDPLVAASPNPANNGLRIVTVRVTPTATDTRTVATTEITTLIRCWPCP